MASQDNSGFSNIAMTGGHPGDQDSPSPPAYSSLDFQSHGYAAAYSQPFGYTTTPSYTQPQEYTSSGYSKTQPQSQDFSQHKEHTSSSSQGYGQAVQWPQTPGRTPPCVVQPQHGAYSITRSQVITVGGLAVTPAENTPPPDTSCGLIFSILVTIFCAWPCGIAAIVANRQANRLVAFGHHTEARRFLKRMLVWIIVSIIFGISIWVVVGIRIKMIIGDRNRVNTYYYYG